MADGTAAGALLEPLSAIGWMCYPPPVLRDYAS